MSALCAAGTTHVLERTGNAGTDLASSRTKVRAAWSSIQISGRRSSSLRRAGPLPENIIRPGAGQLPDAGCLRGIFASFRASSSAMTALGNAVLRSIEHRWDVIGAMNFDGASMVGEVKCGLAAGRCSP